MTDVSNGIGQAKGNLHNLILRWHRGKFVRQQWERAHTLREAPAGDFDEVSVRAGLVTNPKPKTKEITTTSRVTAISLTQVCGASHILNRRTAADDCPHNGVVAVTELENRHLRITNTPIRRIRVFRRRQCLYEPLAFRMSGASLRIWLSHPTFWTASTPILRISIPVSSKLPTVVAMGRPKVNGAR